MAKVKFIPNHVDMKCYRCKGLGVIGVIIDDIYITKQCPNCGGIGIYTQTNYYLIYTNKQGQKMAFGVDTIK